VLALRALFLLPVGFAAFALGACARGAGDDTITVIGERAGVLVWHSVRGVDAYEIEILAGEDTVVHHATTTDTVAPLPPTFMPTERSQWLVRGLRDGRAVARSERQRIY